MIRDLRFSLRNLRSNPGFAFVAILTLALGIGANTAIFSVVNAVLLKSLPYPDPDRLALITETYKHGQLGSVAWPNFLDWRKEDKSFESLSAFVNASYNLTGSGEPEIVDSLDTSASFFPALGATPAAGRFYRLDEDQPGAPGVVVLTYDFWQSRFQGDSSVVGRSIHLNDVAYTVIGVAPKGFRLIGRHSDIFVPIGRKGSQRNWLDRANHPGIRVVARLKKDVPVEQGRAGMETIVAALTRQYPASNEGRGIWVQPLTESVVADSKPTLRMLLAAVGFVLLTACANVANLVLARGLSRQREISIRAALGATRGQVVRQLLVESMVLAVAGGLAGCLLAAWGVDTLLRFAPSGIPRLGEARLDFTVLGFTIAVSLITGLLFGLIPALRLSRPDLNASLKSGGRGNTAGRESQRLRSWLLTVEVALALLMTAGSGLMLRSIVALQNVNPGFRTENVLTFKLALPDRRYPTNDKRTAFFRSTLENLRALPGIESAAMVGCVPLAGGCWSSEYSIGGRPVTSNALAPRADFNDAGPDYFHTLNVPVIEGRVFTEADNKDSAKVVVINQSLARRMFPGESPLGKTIHLGYAQEPGPMQEIVGVVGDVQRYGLDHASTDEVYFPVAQDVSSSEDFVVRTHGDPMSYARAVENAIHQVDRDEPISSFRSMDMLLDETLEARRFSTILLGIFAAVALGLAAVGIYGVMAYAVSQRTMEVGIRMALGARYADVLKLVLAQGLGWTLAGVAAGLAASLALTWLIASELYGVRPRDPATMAAASALLVMVALIACYVPARRAANLDPVVALRSE